MMPTQLIFQALKLIFDGTIALIVSKKDTKIETLLMSMKIN